MLVILLVVVIDLIGFGIIIPFLPFYAESFGASPQRVTMLMAIFSIAQFIAAPFWGAMSDKFGRKVIICITLMGSVIAYIFLSLASSLLTLFIARALAGFMAGNISTAQAYIADISTKGQNTKDKLIKSVDDFEGLKMRGPTRVISKMLEGLGATPVGMPVPKVAPSLSKGVIDGMVVPWEIMPSFKLQELTKAHTNVAGNRGLYTTPFLFTIFAPF